MANNRYEKKRRKKEGAPKRPLAQSGDFIVSSFESSDKVNTISSKVRVIEERLEGIDETLVKTYQKMGIVKYDAFKEMGGKLSFSLALLNQDNTGILISSMHSREGCYTYTKEIIKGESFVLLADEEREALNQAMQKDVI